MTASICDNVSDALHLSLLNDHKKKPDLLNNCLIASARSLQFNKIEFEETGSHQVGNYEFLKSRNVIILSSNNAGDSTCDHDKQLKDECGPSHIKVSKGSGLPQPKRILYPLTLVRLGWDSGWQVGSGMQNLGNTCYLNSTLQALYHVPAFANWLMSETHTSNDYSKCECVTCGMRITLMESQKSPGSIKPWRVYSKLRDICSYFTPMNQEDAHEFLRYLINAMVKSYLHKARVNEKELDSYSKETTPLHQILGGYLRSAVRCLTCSHVSITYQHFQDLLVDARNANTLDDALKSFFSRETLDDCGYKCEACNKKVSATKQFFVERPPMVLCIALKRFSPTGGKLSKKVQYKTKICIKNYLTPRQNNPQSLTYRLVSVVNHIGNSQDSGHYTAVGLGPGGNYYMFDDSSVSLVLPHNIVSSNAYILFYELEKSDSMVLQELLSPFKSAYKRKHEEITTTLKSNGNSYNNDKFKKLKHKYDSAMENKHGFPISPSTSKESSPNSSLSSDSNDNNNFNEQKSIKNVISKNKSKLVQNLAAGVASTSSDIKTVNMNGNSSHTENKSGSYASGSGKNGDQKLYKTYVLNRNGSMGDNARKSGGDSYNNNSKTGRDDNENHRQFQNGCSHKSDRRSSEDKSTFEKDEYSRPSSPKSQIKPVKFVKSFCKDGSSSDKEEYRKKDKLTSASQKAIVLKKDDTKATVQGWEVSTNIPLSSPSPSRNGIVNSRLVESDDVDPLAHKASISNTSSCHQNSNNNNNSSFDYNSHNKNGIHGNDNSSFTNGSDKKDVVSKLLRHSHSGYGAPVSSWNGTHSQLDRQVYEDKKNQRKRAMEAEDEMDRGREKKVRRHNYYSGSSSSNPYQEVQNHRISWNSNNRQDNYQPYNRSKFHYIRFNRNGNRYNNHQFNHRGNHFHHRNQYRRNC